MVNSRPVWDTHVFLAQGLTHSTQSALKHVHLIFPSCSGSQLSVPRRKGQSYAYVTFKLRVFKVRSGVNKLNLLAQGTQTKGTFYSSPRST